MNADMILPLVVALAGSTGLWAFITMKSKQSHEKELKDDAKVALFNETLMEQVAKLSDKVDVLTSQKEKLLIEMAEVKTALATANVTITHLEEMLRSRSK